jgi:hypothetical protein
VQFRLIGPGAFLIVVPTHVNGHGPFAFGFDTGGAHTNISSQLAERLGLPLTGKGESYGFGSAVEFRETALETLAVNAVVVPNVRAAVTDFTPFAARLGESIDGILAHDFFGRFVVTIDYPNRILELAD